jgi:hypothetical protein
VAAEKSVLPTTTYKRDWPYGESRCIKHHMSMVEIVRG